VLARAASGATTGGMANPVVSSVELAGATITSILAIVAPVVAVLLFLTVVVLFSRKILKKFRSSPSAPEIESRLPVSASR